jgi:hypothetical protein
MLGVAMSATPPRTTSYEGKSIMACATRRDGGMDEWRKPVVPLALQEVGASLGRSCRWMQAGGEIAGPERYG